jgi:hypothetical protein
LGSIRLFSRILPESGIRKPDTRRNRPLYLRTTHEKVEQNMTGDHYFAWHNFCALSMPLGASIWLPRGLLFTEKIRHKVLIWMLIAAIVLLEFVATIVHHIRSTWTPQRPL